ncbi:MAG TPA: efflux RND transporter periplasmic adaptor subunit [Vicinamibacterales bacterium]|nr:efflux RND transporter periplasmic adaptor subunit [Vicinamibacterales bacterium]
MLTLLAAACGGSHPAERRVEQPPTDVRVVAVTAADLPRAYEAGGVVRARTTAAITSRLLAPLVEVRVAPGDRVRAGQVLASLDARDLSAAERRAAAGKQAAAEAGRAATSERDAAEAALALATAHHKRITMLHERKSATDDELDQAVAGLRAARSRLAAVEARVAESSAGLLAAAAGADAATVSASWAVITAPFDGVITEKLVEPGNMAAAGMPLFRMEQAGPMRLDVRLDESRAASIGAGQQVDVLFDVAPSHLAPGLQSGRADVDSGLQSRRVTGRVTEIARAAEAGAHAFLVKIELPPDVRVPSGAFARARFAGRARPVVALPAAAVVRRGQLTSVFVRDGERAQLRLVEVGDALVSSDGADVVEVLAGLRPGERVIVDPPPALRDGTRVRESGGARPQPQEAR